MIEQEIPYNPNDRDTHMQTLCEANQELRDWKIFFADKDRSQADSLKQ
jgi:hypothetical protein